MKYSSKYSRQLQKIVHESEPLGPVDISEVTDQEVLVELFESQNRIYEGITKHPSIVVGRRGSGKTTFLRSLIHDADKNTVVVEIPGSKAFERVVDALVDGPGPTHVFAESVAELWDWIFWVSIYEQAKKEYPEIASKVLTTTQKAAGWLSKVKPILKGSKSEAVRILTNVLAAKEEFSKENLENIREDTHQILKEAKAQALILFDSLEDYKLDEPRMDDAIKGLLKAAGRFNQIRNGVEIRLCLPSELYYTFRKLSSNSIKDFRHLLILHWHAGELLSLAAHRYKIFLNLHSKDVPPEKLNFLNNLDIHNRKDAIEFWRSILPTNFTNTLNIEEDPVAYILRHTQLLPRQIILLLNTVLRLHFRRGGSPVQISEAALIDGVAAAEKEIWQEVCNAFQGVYPDAADIVKAVVGELDLQFTNSTLQSVYVQHVKRALKDKVEMDFHEFKRMAEEIGLIGAVLDETQMYVEAVFEYTQGEELLISTHTNMCLHPLYCGFQGKTAYKDSKIVIYPFGTDPQGEDVRDI